MGFNALNAGTIAAVITLDNSRFNAGVNGSIASLAKFADKSNSTGQRVTHLGNAFTSLGVAMTKTVSVPIAAAMIASAVAAVRFETAMTGVAKTANLSEMELEKLSGEILDLSKEIPVTAEELAGIAEVAGQLGIKTENLAGFTETMAMMATATNMTAEEAATQLARFANITQMAQGDFDRLGSVVVDLGNNFATTEAEIAEAGQRLAGAGKLVRMSEAEIMGVAAAYTSLGINVEAGGTAISRVLREIETQVQTGGDSLAKFAEVSGMSAEEFQRAWRDNSAETFNTVVKGLNGIYISGGNVIQTLRDMGFTEIRVTDAMSRLATSGVVLGDALTHARTAWEDNNALMVEAERRYATTESQITLLGNQAKVVGIQFGNMMLPAIQSIVGALRDFFNWIENMNEGTKEFIGTLALIGFTAGPTLAILGKVITVYGHAMMAATAAAGGTRLLATNYTMLEKTVAWFMLRSKAATAARLAETASTTTNSVAFNANAAARARAILAQRQSVVATNVNTKATLKDTIAKIANTVATKAGAAANKLFTASLLTNPLTWVVGAVAGIAALVLAIKAAKSAGEELTATSKRQKKEMEEAQAVYDEVVATTEEGSVAQQEAKKALDDATAAFENNKLTVDEWKDKIEESKNRTEELNTTLVGMTDTFNGEAGNIRSLVDEYDLLSSKTNRTAAEKTRLAQVTYELNNSVLGCNIQYDALNDTLGGTTDILDELVDIEIERRKGELAAEKMNELYDEQTELLAELEQAEMQAKDAQAEYDKELEKANATMTVAEARFGITSNATTEAAQAASDAAAEVERLNGEIEENKKQLQDNFDTMETYVKHQTAVEVAAKLSSQAGYSQKAAIDRVNEAYQLQGENAIKVADLEAYSKAEMAAATEAATEEVMELVGEMPGLSTALTNAGYSVDQFGQKLVDAGMDAETFGGIVEDQMKAAGNAVEEFDASSHTSVADFKKNLADRTAAQETWSNSYKAIMEKTGLDGNSAFIQYLGSLPLEQAGLLEEMANDPNLAQIAANYDKSMGDAYSNSIKWLEQMGAEGKEAAAKIGEGVGEGVGEGMKEVGDALVANGKVLMNATIEAMREAADVHSPSRKTIPIGEGIMDGVVVGMDNNSDKLSTSINASMNKAISSMNGKTGQFRSVGSQMMTAFAGALTAGRPQVVNSLNGTMRQATSSSKNILVNGMRAAGVQGAAALRNASMSGLNTWKSQTISSVRATTNQVKSITVSGMREAGNQGAKGYQSGFNTGMAGASEKICASVKSAATSVSTSGYTNFYNAGKWAGQGLIDGLNSKKQSVIDTARAIGNAAARELNKSLDINSPSRVTRKTGVGIGEGLEYGMMDKFADVEKAARKMAMAAVPDQSLIDTARSVPKLDIAESVDMRDSRSIDYDRLGTAVARAMGGQSIDSLVSEVKSFGDGVVNAISGMGVSMDGKKVGNMVTNTVDKNIGRKVRVRGEGL